MRTYLTMAAVASSALFTGCASIVGGTNRTLLVETRTPAGPVAGASCTLSNNKGSWSVTSPGPATVGRSYNDLHVRCEKPALGAGIVAVKSSTKVLALGNAIFGGVIGVGIDVATGAAYDYPERIDVVMGAAAEPVLDAPLPLADAGEDASVPAPTSN